MSKLIKVYIVNAFTESIYGGSPTAVVLEADELKDDEMQAITKQVPTSHTCFVFNPINNAIPVRFFTSNGEILNCGHGTIAIHYLRAKISNFFGTNTFFQQAKEGLQEVQVISEHGSITVYLKQNEIKFNQPSADTIPSLLQSFSLDQPDLNDHPVILASPGSNRFLLGLRSEEMLNKLEPDFDKLKLICGENKAIGCFVYATNSVHKATARMFAPNIGIKEDIINGNSSGCLGTYLRELTGKDELELHVSQGQKSGREGIVIVRVKKMDDRVETVIGGNAVVEGEVEKLIGL